MFGKPTTRPYRRMGVVLAPDVATAKLAAGKIQVFDITPEDHL